MSASDTYFNVSPTKRKHEHVNESANILTENNSPKKQCYFHISKEISIGGEQLDNQYQAAKVLPEELNYEDYNVNNVICNSTKELSGEPDSENCNNNIVKSNSETNNDDLNLSGFSTGKGKSIRKPSRIDSQLFRSLFDFSDNFAENCREDITPSSPSIIRASSSNFHKMVQETNGPSQLLSDLSIGNEKPIKQVSDAQLTNSESVFTNSSDRIQESNSSKVNEKQEKNIYEAQLADKGMLFFNTPAKSSKFGGFSTASGKPAKKVSDVQRAYAESIFSSNSNRILQESNSRNAKEKQAENIIKDQLADSESLFWSNPTKLGGFCSATGKPTKEISEAQLAKARSQLGVSEFFNNEKLDGKLDTLDLNEMLSKASNTIFDSSKTRNIKKFATRPLVLNTPIKTPIESRVKQLQTPSASHSKKSITTPHQIKIESLLTPLQSNKNIHKTSLHLRKNLYSILQNRVQHTPTPEPINNNKSHTPGSRVRLREIVTQPPLSYAASTLLKFGIKSEIIYMTPANAITYRFQKSENNESTWGFKEARDELIQYGADPKLIDETWVENHYGWILWKIASMIRSFPAMFQDWWCPTKVIEHLRYRYEREINCAHRSALKLIIEKDGSPSWPMILCVSDIYEVVSSTISSQMPPEAIKNQTNSVVKNGLVLTDSWYKIRASIDPPLQRAINSKKLRIGCKLEICGAKLKGGEDAKPALEVDDSTHLILSANSTRLATWDAKLGYSNKKPRMSLRSLSPDGGFIPVLDVIILRKYPMLFRETFKDNKPAIIRSEAEEELEIRNICDPPIFSKSDGRSATLTIWRPDDYTSNRIQEGRRYLIYNVTTPNSQRYPLYLETPIRLNSMGHSTSVKEVALDPEKLEASRYKQRSITPCSELWKAQKHDEFDLVVCILVVWESKLRVQANGKEMQVQAIMVTDASEQLILIEINIFSQEAIFKPKAIIFLKNLSYRKCEYQFGIHFLSTTNETQIKISPHENYAKFAIKGLDTWLQKNTRIFEDLCSTAQSIGGPVLNAIYYDLF
ncbi:11853_t:CDS:10 [Ambispora gerdemannii]|uniref:11853_t:CDS:1 n=1 Tax=Ambispora gerdemannii TaxID=144530 RepID=A0A9N9FJS5_9GLOM|nr:11853_t:CDS:10 [Ambispora gerdemannii]